MRLTRKGPRHRGEPSEPEFWDLQLGGHDAFEDEMQRKIAWLQFGPKMLADALDTGSRASAYWAFEALAKLVVGRTVVWDLPRQYARARVVGYRCVLEDDVVALLRLGLATPRERAEYEARAELREAHEANGRVYQRGVCEAAGIPEDWTKVGHSASMRAASRWEVEMSASLIAKNHWRSK